MFESRIDILNDGRVHKFGIKSDGKLLLYSDVLSLWQRDESFREFFISLLRKVPFVAYRWETPPVLAETVNREFEFVILDSPGLDRTPDPAAYASYFTTANSDAGIVVFENLGKDAILIVPSPHAAESAYGHLAAFSREAPNSQNHALWRIIGETMQQRISNRPVWLSTAGGGVSWLHVRLDATPKYYGFRPYKKSE